MKNIFIILVMLSFFQTYTYSQEIVELPDRTTVKIGVLGFLSQEKEIAKWDNLAEYLEKVIPEYRFIVEVADYEGLNNKIKMRKVDYVLTNPSHYISINQHYDISGAMATLVEKNEDLPERYFGGVIFSLNNDNSPKTLQDLKNKRISIVSTTSLGGYQAASYELLKEGIRLPYQAELIETDMPHSNVVFEVLSGNADAGFIRTGVIESLISEGKIDLNQLRIINQKDYQDYPNIISTELYPQWPFLALSHADEEISRRITSALLSMENYDDEAIKMGIHGFNVPSNYIVVEQMMRELKLPPFDKNTGITLEEFWMRYSFLILVLWTAIIILIVVFVKNILEGKRIQEKNKELEKLNNTLEEANKKLELLSSKDDLTGLLNKMSFMNLFRERLEIAIRSKSAISLAVIDIDNFKIVNDTLGHVEGDLLIKKIGHILKEEVKRTTDLSGRFGGDEFMLFFYDTSEEGAKVVLERIQNKISLLKPMKLESYETTRKVTVSIGLISIIPDKYICEQQILRKADEALYKAKENGRNNITVYKDGF